MGDATPNFDEANASPVGDYKHHRRSALSLISRQVKAFIPTATDHQQFAETVQITKLSPTANVPTQGTPGSTGFDVTSTQHTIILPVDIFAICPGSMVVCCVLVTSKPAEPGVP
jgi:hypothetical protein